MSRAMTAARQSADNPAHFSLQRCFLRFHQQQSANIISWTRLFMAWTMLCRGKSPNLLACQVSIPCFWRMPGRPLTNCFHRIIAIKLAMSWWSCLCRPRRMQRKPPSGSATGGIIMGQPAMERPAMAAQMEPLHQRQLLPPAPMAAQMGRPPPPRGAHR